MLIKQDTSQTGADRRRYKRLDLLHTASLREGERIVDCIIRDISMSGARVLTEEQIDAQQNLKLEIEGVGALNGRIVWQRVDQIGIQFLDEPGTVETCIKGAWGHHVALS
jgi:hypothetical protein